jgi:hypothetical protein
VPNHRRLKTDKLVDGFPRLEVRTTRYGENCYAESFASVVRLTGWQEETGLREGRTARKQAGSGQTWDELRARGKLC